MLTSYDKAIYSFFPLLLFSTYRSTFHGSLRKSPKPTPVDLVEEEDTSKAQKTAEESSRPTGERRPVEEQKRDVTAAVHNDRAKTVSAVLPPDDDEACLLCYEPVDARIEPCGHSVLCRSHANTAKRCPQCRVCVDL